MSGVGFRHAVAVTTLRGQAVTDGVVIGEALVSTDRIAFNLGVDERTGIVVERGHAIEGAQLAGKVLVFPGGKGSTASSFSLMQIVQGGRGPLGLVNGESDALVAAGAVLARIPLVHRCVPDALAAISTGDLVRVDGDRGTVEILERRA